MIQVPLTEWSPFLYQFNDWFTHWFYPTLSFDIDSFFFLSAVFLPPSSPARDLSLPSAISCPFTSWSCYCKTAFQVFLEGPILYRFSSISHSWQRSNNSVFDMHCPKPIRGPEFLLSKSRSTELYSEQSVSAPAPLNANELRLSTPTWRALPATSLSGRGCPLR